MPREGAGSATAGPFDPQGLALYGSRFTHRALTNTLSTLCAP